MTTPSSELVKRAREFLAAAFATMYPEDARRISPDDKLAVPLHTLPTTWQLSLKAVEAALLSTREDETGWLIEEETGGFIHWIALSTDEWPRYDVRTIYHNMDYEHRRQKWRNPVERVKDANEAIRFARQQDAEAFMRLFDRFLLHPKATEHCWPALHPSPNRSDG